MTMLFFLLFGIELLFVVLLSVPFCGTVRISLLTAFDSSNNKTNPQAGGGMGVGGIIYYSLLFLLLLLLLSTGFSYQSSLVEERLSLSSNNNSASEFIHLRLRRYEIQQDLLLLIINIVLFFIIGRLSSLIREGHKAEMSKNAMEKQAKSASAFAKQLMEDNNKDNNKTTTNNNTTTNNKKDGEKDGKNDSNPSSISSSDKEKIDKLEKQLTALQSQSKNQSIEYDRLIKENERLKESLADYQALMGPTASKAKKTD